LLTFPQKSHLLTKKKKQKEIFNNNNNCDSYYIANLKEMTKRSVYLKTKPRNFHFKALVNVNISSSPLLWRGFR
jgi:hypothetical protein